MAANLPAKSTIRARWLEVVAEVAENAESESEPLYVTLGGAGGHDIQMLIDAGIVKLAQNAETIDRSEQWKVAAIEVRLQEREQLKSAYPGLRVIDGRVQDLFSANTNTIDELVKHRGVAPSRGRVVNLDYNGSVETTQLNGEVCCPLVDVVEHLARTHADDEPVDWYLCLTFNATINWDAATEKYFKELVAENCQKYDDFKDGVARLLGNALFGHFEAVDVHTPLSGASSVARQKSLQIAISKKVIRDCCARHWRITIEDSLRYKSANNAPMVTWIMKFEHSLAADADALEESYKSSVETILPATGKIDAGGAVTRDQ